MRYDDCRTGMVFGFEHSFSAVEVRKFADLCGDRNRLHIDPAFAANTPYKKNIVHGLLLGALFSRLVGMYCPGEDGAYLSQSLDFRLPVFIGDRLSVRGEIENLSPAARMAVIKTEILKDGRQAVTGRAKVIFF